MREQSTVSPSAESEHYVHATPSVVTATWALFVGLTLLLAAAGLAGSLVGLRAEREGFSSLAIGIVAAAYYAGFLVGSNLAFRVLARVGHIRVYAALTGFGSVAVLLHAVSAAPPVWAAARFCTGLAMAGLYVVAESWLNGLASNDNRGRLLAVYMLVTSAAFGLGQILLSPMSGSRVAGFIVASILTSLAVIPVALSESSHPPMTEVLHISVRALARLVPTGVGAALLVGFAHGVLLGMSSFYGAKSGFSPALIALFAALPTVGGVIFQWPVSAASDDLDRRVVGLAAAVLASVAAVGGIFADPGGMAALGALLLIGGMSYPLYSIAAAVTNDWVEPEMQGAAASVLITLYGVGAFAGPMVCGAVMDAAGPSSWWWMLATVHGALAAFLLYRLFAWREPINRRPWAEVSIPARAFFVPATLVSAGRRMVRARATGPSADRS